MINNTKKDESEMNDSGLVWKAKQFIKDEKWIILFLFAVVSFGLGYWGFSDASISRGEQLSSLDIAYRSLQLFNMQSGDIYHPPPLILNIARFLSPAITALAIILLIFTFFYRDIRLFILKFRKKSHAVICGLGYVGPVIALYLLKKGIPVVIIEKDKDNKALEVCSKQGALTIVGDASIEYYLKKANIQKARCLFTVSGDDETNTRIALSAQSILEQTSRLIKEEPLTCYVHLEDPRLTKLLKVEEFAATKKNIIRFDFFNIYHNAARCLIDNNPLFCTSFAPIQVPHFLVIGVGRMGESLIIHTVSRWRELLYGMTGKKMQISFIDREAKRKYQAIIQKNPSLLKYCDLFPLEMDTRSSEFNEGKFLPESPGIARVTAVYICISDQTQALVAGLVLQQKLIKTTIPIIVRTTWSEGFSRFFESVNKRSREFENLTTFPLVSCTCCFDMTIRGTNEVVARSIHDGYVLNERRKVPPPEGPYICSWKDLPEHMKRSNRLKADDIWSKLQVVSCSVDELTNWDEPLFAFTDNEIEILAKKEHERWMQEKFSEGYRYGPKKDEANRIHDSLLPWDHSDLSEEEREKDRETIRMIPSILARIDLKVIRLKKMEGDNSTPP